MMEMIKQAWSVVTFVLRAGVVVGLCLASFEYIQAHDSTAMQEELASSYDQIESLEANLDNSALISDNSRLKGELLEACDLLTQAGIGNDLCPACEDDVSEGEENSDG